MLVESTEVEPGPGGNLGGRQPACLATAPAGNGAVRRAWPGLARWPAVDAVPADEGEFSRHRAVKALLAARDMAGNHLVPVPGHHPGSDNRVDVRGRAAGVLLCPDQLGCPVGEPVELGVPEAGDSGVVGGDLGDGAQEVGVPAVERDDRAEYRRQPVRAAARSGTC